MRAFRKIVRQTPLDLRKKVDILQAIPFEKAEIKMAKRVIAMFFALMLSLGLLFVRIFEHLSK